MREAGLTPLNASIARTSLSGGTEHRRSCAIIVEEDGS